MSESRDELDQVPHCPGCGRSHVVAGLDAVLLETRPTVRRHACGVGGPGSGEIERSELDDGGWHCKHCMSIADKSGLLDEYWPGWVLYPCATIRALEAGSTLALLNGGSPS